MRLERLAGFTLTELLVVVLIMGILAAMGIPAYRKLTETTRADDAKAALQQIATAHASYYMQHSRTYASGTFPSAACGATTTGACALVATKYLEDRDWGSIFYDFALCDGSTTGACLGVGAGANMLAAATRKAGPPAPYSTWGYYIKTDGAIVGAGTNPP